MEHVVPGSRIDDSSGTESYPNASVEEASSPPPPIRRSRPGWTEEPVQPPNTKENLRTLMALVDAAGEGMKKGEVLSEGCWLEMCDTLKIIYAQTDVTRG